jgi:hypothetical protein
MLVVFVITFPNKAFFIVSEPQIVAYDNDAFVRHEFNELLLAMAQNYIKRLYFL